MQADRGAACQSHYICPTVRDIVERWGGATTPVLGRFEHAVLLFGSEAWMYFEFDRRCSPFVATGVHITGVFDGHFPVGRVEAADILWSIRCGRINTSQRPFLVARSFMDLRLQFFPVSWTTFQNSSQLIGPRSELPVDVRFPRSAGRDRESVPGTGPGVQWHLRRPGGGRHWTFRLIFHFIDCSE